jgi:hypothetical protein
MWSTWTYVHNMVSVAAMECNPGIPKTQVTRPFSKPVNPGLYAFKNPCLAGLIAAVDTVQKSDQKHKQKALN